MINFDDFTTAALAVTKLCFAPGMVRTVSPLGEFSWYAGTGNENQRGLDTRFANTGFAALPNPPVILLQDTTTAVL